MFRNAQFNGDISNWNTKRLIVLSGMFQNSLCESDISKWDLRLALDNGRLHDIFLGSHYTGDLSGWRVSNKHDYAMVGTEFKGILLRSIEPIRKAFYVQLFGTTQRLHHYLRNQEFKGVHFDVLRLSPNPPTWCKKEDYVWARKLEKLGQSIGMDDEALREYGLAEYRKRMSPPTPAIVLDIGNMGLL